MYLFIPYLIPQGKNIDDIKITMIKKKNYKLFNKGLGKLDIRILK